MKEYENSLGDDNEGFNDSPPAPVVPKDKEHSECIEEIFSLENLFSAPHATKDEFEIIKMYNGNGDNHFARIFFEFNKGGDITKSKQELEYVKGNGAKLINNNVSNKDHILKNVKKIVVDRTKIDGCSQGKANDEIVFDNQHNILTAVEFYNKPEGYKQQGEGLAGNAVYNKVMVLRYLNTYRGPQEFIVDMDNNLIITQDNLKLYWHSKDKDANGNGFDDKKNTSIYRQYIWKRKSDVSSFSY